MGNAQRGLSRRELLRIRVNDKERAVFGEAARIAGLSLSSWCRMVLRESATALLVRSGKEPGL